MIVFTGQIKLEYSENNDFAWFFKHFRQIFNRCSKRIFSIFRSRLFAEKNLLDYAGGVSPRNNLGSRAYTSTEYPPNLALRL